MIISITNMSIATHMGQFIHQSTIYYSPTITSARVISRVILLVTIFIY